MATLSALLPKAQQLLHDTQSLVEHLETRRDVSGNSLSRASDNLERLQADIRAMESLISSEPVNSYPLVCTF